MNNQVSVLRIVCADEQGLVAQVTGILFKRHCNIIENDEFVDRENRRFFMRTTFEGKHENVDILNEVQAVLPQGALIQCRRQRKKKIVILATKEAHCLGDLLIRATFDDLYADILAVISNHNNLSEMTRQLGHKFHFVDHEGLEREEHEERIIQLIDEYSPDYLVMAKYMRILSSRFVDRYTNRIINIHHSFLPAFVGANPYRQAYERGVKIIGATAHFATANLDEGPIIAQGTIPVSHAHSVTDMAGNGRDVEKQVLGRALRLVFDDRVFAHGNQTVIFD